MNESISISSAVAPIHRKASFESEMVTQGLMWERLELLNKLDTWYEIKMIDGYVGWIHEFYLDSEEIKFSKLLLLKERFTYVYENSNLDSRIISVLSIGTMVPIDIRQEPFYKINLFSGSTGFIPVRNKNLLSVRDKIIHLSNQLLGVPYLWGGKSAYGFDCSGFVQIIFKLVGIDLKRDAKEQIKTNNFIKISLDETLPGDLVFFSDTNNCINHVAILIGGNKIIHSYGYVKVESIHKEDADCNKKLASLNHIYISIAGLISN